MKTTYISPETTVVKADLPAFCNSMSTGTVDNTGGDESGPGKGDDNEEAGAKSNTIFDWDRLDDTL